jgi:hypothetical protein
MPLQGCKVMERRRLESEAVRKNASDPRNPGVLMPEPCAFQTVCCLNYAVPAGKPRSKHAKIVRWEMVLSEALTMTEKSEYGFQLSPADCA